ncbi:MAG: TatD family hydrolase, partial [Abitibacteriaceae bacterium]|nr:TatD family hydrolase [Abditibacteriaceae bacterium]
WATAGVHPQHALEYNDQSAGTTEALFALAKNPLIRAIGEIGLDFVYDDQHPQYPGASREVQADVLRQQLEIAITLSLPVVIHNREADEALLAIIKDYSSQLPGGVFHCFGSPLEIARRVLDLGFHLGFTGLVTFKNAEAVREVAKFCPLDRLLIETDAPYLAPVPYRGKTNEPSYLPRVAETVASLHNLEVQEIAAITTHNAMQLFHLDEKQAEI